MSNGGRALPKCIVEVDEQPFIVRPSTLPDVQDTACRLTTNPKWTPNAYDGIRQLEIRPRVAEISERLPAVSLLVLFVSGRPGSEVCFAWAEQR
jgi:hypothetical protein